MQTIKIEDASIISSDYIVGKKEYDGTLKKYFKNYIEDLYFGESTFEKAETKMLEKVLQETIKKAQLDKSEIDFAFSGDLLNQCVSSAFCMRELEIPYIRALWSLLYICRKYYYGKCFCFK